MGFRSGYVHICVNILPQTYAEIFASIDRLSNILFYMGGYTFVIEGFMKSVSMDMEYGDYIAEIYFFMTAPATMMAYV